MNHEEPHDGWSPRLESNPGLLESGIGVVQNCPRNWVPAGMKTESRCKHSSYPHWLSVCALFMLLYLLLVLLANAKGGLSFAGLIF